MKWALLIVVLFSLGTLANGGGCSTNSICNDACEEWQTCRQVEGDTVNYPFEVCMQECEDEGDWTRSYVRCLESYDTCPELGNQCG